MMSGKSTPSSFPRRSESYQTDCRLRISILPTRNWNHEPAGSSGSRFMRPMGLMGPMGHTVPMGLTMKRFASHVVLVACLFVTGKLYAIEPLVIDVWPGATPGDVGIKGQETSRIH